MDNSLHLGGGLRRILVATAIVALTIGVAVAAIVALGETTSSGGSDVVLEGVPETHLSESGYRLQKPGKDARTIGIDQAIAVATGTPSRQEAAVREAVLVRLVNDRIGGDSGRLVWAVNLDPASVQAEQPGGALGAELCPGSAHPEYAVVFIDAVTAEFVFDMQKTLLPPSPKNGDCPNSDREDGDYPSPTDLPSA